MNANVETMRSALWLPLFDGLADPVVVARLAAEAEEAGWHGVFVWDHLSWRAPVRQVADPWITLAAIAAATEHLRLGPMVTPLARRRPAKIARETATLDMLSGGRLTLGAGLGSDRFGGELSATGEQLDGRQRAQMLDEALEILTAAWSGQPVHHRGEHYTVDGIQFLPRPAQQPRVPVWIAGLLGNSRPLRRAARYDGFFPVNLEHPDQLAEITAVITGLREHATAPYDIAIALPPGTDPAPYAKAGATWWLTEFDPEAVSLDQVRGVLRSGPALRSHRPSDRNDRPVTNAETASIRPPDKRRGTRRTSYAAAEAGRDGLGIRFVSVLPQLTLATALGAVYVAAYAARQGMDTAAFLEASGPALTAEQAGKAIIDLTGPGYDQDAYLLTATGLSPVA